MEAPQSIREFADRYQNHADGYYRRPDGTPTGEADNMRDALRGLKLVAGDKPLADLCAEDVCACQDLWVREDISRKVINDRVNRIRRAVRWATKPPHRWFSLAVLEDIRLADPLKKGRSKARETEDVKPVSWETVSTTIAAADFELATMIELHWWTGMRPDELCSMKRCEIKTEQVNTPDGRASLMIYRPTHHKTAHHGKNRIIVIGPNGAAVLKPWLQRIPSNRQQLWRLTREQSYYQAVTRTARRAKAPHWCPLQIRHSYATRLRAAVGLDATKTAMGHSKIETTQIYAEPDMTAVFHALAKLG